MARDNRPYGRRLGAIVALLAALSVTTSYVFASHVFSDVSGSAFYHNAVTAVRNAGITAGCGSGRYCPNNAVTRGQMAVFLDLLGGLRLGAGGQPRTVVDALSVQGTEQLRFFKTVVLSGAGSSACSPAIPLPVQVDFGDYAVMHQLFSTPPDIEPSEVNIQIRDDNDAAPEEYEICLKTLDGDPLPDGQYKTFGTEMAFIGQGRFGN